MICKLIKLVTGESIIGNITEETKVYIDIHRPIKVFVAPKGQDALGIMMTKWDYISNYDVPARVFKHSIVSVSEPHEGFKESYLEMYNQLDKDPEEEDAEESISNEFNEMKKQFDSSNTTIRYHWTPTQLIIRSYWRLVKF